MCVCVCVCNNRLVTKKYSLLSIPGGESAPPCPPLRTPMIATLYTIKEDAASIQF